MNGYIFYEEFNTPADKRTRRSMGNVSAVFGPRYNGKRDAIAGVYSHANSAVCVTGVSLEWLRKSCRRISEARARQIHPQLFRRLDMHIE